MRHVLPHSAWLRAHPTRALAWALGSALLIASTGSARAELRVRLVDADQVLERSSARSDGRSADFVSEDGVRIGLVLHPQPEEVLNPSFDGTLVPVDSSQVREALAEIRGLGGFDLDAVIYTLPGLPEEAGSSFCVGREVFLSPTFAIAPTEQIASTVVHELGHVVQHRFLPTPEAQGWKMYRDLRGLDPATFNAGAVHRNRPAEIFAEDFRMLYGGHLANYSGSLENPNLADPDAVAGLRDFFAGLIAGAYEGDVPLARASNYPNPFNPSTTIRVVLRPEQVALGGEVRLEIFDLRGRRVRALPSRSVSRTVEWKWDGRDERGSSVASGRYCYRVRVGRDQVSASMLLLQ